MAYITATSACFVCDQLFSYNPMRVPSVRVKGQREPICAGCIATINPLRIAKGLDPIQVLPGAYDACDEREMVWEQED